MGNEIDMTDSQLFKNFDPEEEKRLDNEEDIFDEKNSRLVIKPIDAKYDIIWKLYKKQKECFWTPEDIDFSRDYYDFIKLDENKQYFIKMILAFFAGADSIVVNNIKDKFSLIKIKEAEVAYGFQEAMENIHGEVYAEMLINIVTDEKERNELINAFRTVESIKMMINWAQKWSACGRRIGYTIFAFVLFEGLMFSEAFAGIFWLKRTVNESIMEGFFTSNEFIARDEGLHTNFGCVMYYFVKHKIPLEHAIIMTEEAVAIAKLFMKNAIRVDLIGMNTDMMGKYIEYVADRLMVYLGYGKIYNSANPFPFMETIGFLNKNNFFEKRTSEYQRALNQNNKADWEFKILDNY